MKISKRNLFHNLCLEAQACKICPDLAGKTAVLSELNGSINPRVFFVAEAPGRQGADRTRRPFWGDKSGENFQRLLDSIGLAREEIFITNAVICSPRTATDANRKPKKAEINNCSSFLRRQIELIRPSVVATLGSVALEALKAIEYHEFKLKTDVANILNWYEISLVPLYHPSPQVIASHRRMDQQLDDFKVLQSVLLSNKLKTES